MLNAAKKLLIPCISTEYLTLCHCSVFYTLCIHQLPVHLNSGSEFPVSSSDSGCSTRSEDPESSHSAVSQGIQLSSSAKDPLLQPRRSPPALRGSPRGSPSCFLHRLLSLLGAGRSMKKPVSEPVPIRGLYSEAQWPVHNLT